MFYESSYPKNELAKIAKELESFSNRFLRHDNWNYELEKKCFIGFYFIRKLFESRYKITDAIKTKRIPVISYPFIGKIKLWQPSGFSDEYDYEIPNIENLSIREISHQFIHSQLFFGIKEGKGLKYIYVASDHLIYHKIYEINIKDIIEIFNTISLDYVSSTQSSLDPSSGKLVVINK